MTTAEIIAIGTELLLGETVDTNTSFIARALRNIGVNLFRTAVIGDNVDRIASLMREGLDRADVVITTGGLGPTVDDPTREAAALASGLLLEYHQELWSQITARISLYGKIPGENQKKQAFLPQNSLVIPNPVGTAPAFIIEIDQKSIICLPGVPREMETLLQQEVIPYLRNHFKLEDVLQLRTLHVGGMGEGAIDELIADLESLTNPTVGLATHSGIVSIRIAAKSKSTTEGLTMLEEIETLLRQRLGQNIFGIDSDTLEAVALRNIGDKGWTVTSVEYQTGESLCQRLSRPAKITYHGGITLPDFTTSWGNFLEKEMSVRNSTAGLGLACISTTGDQKVYIKVVTPIGNKQIELSYGGHPNNFIRWSTNRALDLLRRSAI